MRTILIGLFFIVCIGSYAANFSKGLTIEFPNDNSNSKIFFNDTNECFYRLDDKKYEVSTFDKKLRKISSFNWRKQNNYSHLIKSDESGNILVYPISTSSSKSTPAIVFDKNGKVLCDSIISDFRHLAFHDGIVYNSFTGEILFKKDPKVELGQKIFLKDFLILNDNMANPVKLKNIKNGKITGLPHIEGYVPNSGSIVDFDGNLYFLYVSRPPSGAFGDELNSYTYKKKTLVFNKELLWIATFDGAIVNLNEKDKSFTRVIKDSDGNKKIIRWKLNP